MRFIKTPDQAAHLVRVLRQTAADPPPSGKKRKNKGGNVVLANPGIISQGPVPGTVSLDFRHHRQCSCERCQEANAPRRKKRRNGSR